MLKKELAQAKEATQHVHRLGMMQERSTVLNNAWDLVVGAGATLSALVIPLELLPGFSYVGEAQATVLFEWLITTIFATDIVVQYLRTRARETRAGVEQRRPALLPGLLFDVLATLPLRMVFGPTIWQVLRLFKLYRVAGFMHAWRKRHVKNASVLRLIFFVFWLLLSAHWITCGWILLRDTPGALDETTQYLDALYWCVTTLTTVGYGDVTPANNAQTLYAIFVMILGVGVYAYVIGNIASILANINPSKASYLQRVEQLTAFMHYRSLPHPLQRRIRDYYDYLWEKRLGYDENDILQDLPPTLRTDVALFLKRDIIERVPIFQGASDAFIREIALEMEPAVFTPGDYIMREGDRGQDMFFISRGMVEVLAPDGTTIYATLSDGDFFGEIALFLDQPRTASVRAVNYCDLYRLNKSMFDRILARYPDIASQIETLARRRHGSDRPVR